MKAIDWFKWNFAKKDKFTLDNCSFSDIASEIAYKEIALNKVINLIANALCNCEFKTFKENKPIKKDNYYLFNIEPNINQNASEFRHKMISKLIKDNECLIIQENNQFFIADNFDIEQKTLKNSVFYNVTIDNLTMKKRYSAQDVIYLKLNNENMKVFVDGLYESYGKLIAKGIIDYKRKNGIKGKLKISSMFSQNFKDENGSFNQSRMQEYISNLFKSYFTEVNSVLPLQEGFEFTQLEGNQIEISVDEINKGIDGALNYIATAFGLPEGFFRGNVVDVKEQRNDFLSFVVKPIAKLIEREFNRKIFGKEEYIKGSYLKIDTNRIKQIDIFENAGSLDVLTRIGYSHNDLMDLLEEPRKEEDWANRRYITKNYMDILKGGDEGNG